MREDLIETNLEARVIEREGDQDFFIETFLYPMNFEIDIHKPCIFFHKITLILLLIHFTIKSMIFPTTMVYFICKIY